jgi:hypothetical protein
MIHRLLAGAIIALSIAALNLGADAFAADSAAPTASSATPAAAAGEPAPGAGAGGQSQVSQNLSKLMGEFLSELTEFVIDFVVSIIIWAVLLFILGFIVGLLIYFLLRKKKWMKLEAKWYKWVAWMWPVLFVICASLGFGYGGLFFGGGRSINHLIVEKRAIERIVVNVYAAAAFSKTDTTLTGKETPEEMEQILSDSVGLRDMMADEFEGELNDMAGKITDSWWQQQLISLAASALDDKASELSLDQGVDVRLLLVAIQNQDKINAYKKKNPKASVGLAMMSGMLETISVSSGRMVNKFVYTQMAIGGVIGLGIPIILAGLFRLIIVFAVERPKRKRAEKQRLEEESQPRKHVESHLTKALEDQGEDEGMSEDQAVADKDARAPSEIPPDAISDSDAPDGDTAPTSSSTEEKISSDEQTIEPTSEPNTEPASDSGSESGSESGPEPQDDDAPKS